MSTSFHGSTFWWTVPTRLVQRQLWHLQKAGHSNYSTRRLRSIRRDRKYFGKCGKPLEIFRYFYLFLRRNQPTKAESPVTNCLSSCSNVSMTWDVNSTNWLLPIYCSKVIYERTFISHPIRWSHIWLLDLDRPMLLLPCLSIRTYSILSKRVFQSPSANDLPSEHFCFISVVIVE